MVIIYQALSDTLLPMLSLIAVLYRHFRLCLCMRALQVGWEITEY